MKKLFIDFIIMNRFSVVQKKNVGNGYLTKLTQWAMGAKSIAPWR